MVAFQATIRVPVLARSERASAAILPSTLLIEGLNMKHTPGTLVALEAGVNIQPASEHELHAMIGSLPVLIATMTAGHYSEAMPDGSPEPEHTVTPAEALANARRIALAWNAHDELVEALERIVNINGSTGGAQSLVQEFKHIAQAALAKAKGE